MQLYQIVLILAVIALALAVVLVLVWRKLRGEPPTRAERPARVKPARPALRRNRASTPPAAEPADAPAPERRRKLVPASAIEAAREAAAIPAAASRFSEEIFTKLEQAFESYKSQDISLETYAALITAEQQAVERRIIALRADTATDRTEDLADAETAREAVRWCIEWASDLARSDAAGERE